MDSGVWWNTDHGVTKVEHGHNLVTKQQHYVEQYGGSLKN